MRSGALEALSDADCAELLRSHDLGRIAVVDANVRPLIFPINYVFDEGVLVFRTGPGTKLALAPGSEVCFEIDGWDPDAGIGWSVLVKGVARDVTNPRSAATSHLKFWPVHPVAPGSREHWIAVWASEITGRRFQVQDAR
jgi:uncharacterized protein